MDPDLERPLDQRLRRVRVVLLVALAISAWSSLLMPGIGLHRESSPLWIVLGGLGILAVAVTQSAVLYAVVTPWLSDVSRRRLRVGFAAAAVASIPLVGPVGDGWATWAWLGASILGTVPVLVRRWAMVGVSAGIVVVGLGVAGWTGGSILDYSVITASFGLGIAAVVWLQVWLWDLLVQAQRGRAAQAQLAASEERFRFARDVHDLLGHSLTVIALKAELAARLAPVDAARAGQEAAEVQRLAAAALTEMREIVHGYRAVNLRDELTAIGRVLQSSGVRCTVTQPARDLPPDVATQFATVLREASTNVLRHSRAARCAIEIAQDGDETRMTVTNDGATNDGASDDRATGLAGDRLSFGLRGLAERLAEAGGVLRTRHEGGVFTLEAVMRAAP